MRVGVSNSTDTPGAGERGGTQMIEETDRGARGATDDHVALKLEEFLPYRLNVCASLVSQALSRIYTERYKIGVPEWRVLASAIFGQVDRHHLVGKSLEIERDADPVGGGRAKIRIEFHGLTPAYLAAAI